MADLKLVELSAGQVHFTQNPVSSARAMLFAVTAWRNDDIAPTHFPSPIPTRTMTPANLSTSSARNWITASAHFLNHPQTCPHGNPIPAGEIVVGEAMMFEISRRCAPRNDDLILARKMPTPLDARKKPANVKIHVSHRRGRVTSPGLTVTPDITILCICARIVRAPHAVTSARKKPQKFQRLRAPPDRFPSSVLPMFEAEAACAKAWLQAVGHCTP